MDIVPRGKYNALVVAPLSKWGCAAGSEASPLAKPDIALLLRHARRNDLLINGLQWEGYKRFDWSVVGESSCADSGDAR